MVWYPLNWCYQMGVSEIYLITPAESKAALEESLSTNPDLTSLPSPKPTVISPSGITNTSGTAEIFRHAEVKEAITSDFLVLPCDLLSELPGLSLLQEWMTTQAAFNGAATGKDVTTSLPHPLSTDGEKIGRRGGLGVWYETKVENGIKKEQTDFLATVPYQKPLIPAAKNSIRRHISSVVYSMPTDSLNDKIEEEKGFHIRYNLLDKHPNVTLKTTLRDSHIYFFPYWVLEFMQNPKFDNLGEDVLGWWARATWQDELVQKLNLDTILHHASATNTPSASASIPTQMNQSVNVANYISTYTPPSKNESTIPTFLAYSQPPPTADSPAPLIRRVDTTAALLKYSLYLATLPDTSSGVRVSSLASSKKVADPESIPQNAHVDSATCLVDSNVTIAPKCTIKQSVIGSGCNIATGARITGCLLMEGVTVGENVILTGCILGPRCKIEGGARGKDKTDLKECEVQGGFIVPWGTEEKGEKFMTATFGADDDEDGDDHEVNDEE
jgi:translation initiation factor eIF-2B subunit gamma